MLDVRESDDVMDFGPPPPSSVRMRALPPPLPPSVREVPLWRNPAEAALADRMLARLAAGDYEGALLAAEALSWRDPRDADAIDCAQMSRAELEKLYLARLGGLDRVPRVALGADAVAAMNLDPRAVFCLLRVDGRLSVEEIVFGGGIVPHEALRALSELYLRGVLALDR